MFIFGSTSKPNENNYFQQREEEFLHFSLDSMQYLSFIFHSQHLSVGMELNKARLQSGVTVSKDTVHDTHPAL